MAAEGPELFRMVAEDPRQLQTDPAGPARGSDASHARDLRRAGGLPEVHLAQESRAEGLADLPAPAEHLLQAPERTDHLFSVASIR